MIKDELVEKIFKAVNDHAGRLKRYPVSTYRLQFNRTFNFSDACNIIPYLFELGITDIYASPLLNARSGSMHGYDVIDHNSLNPEIGSLDELGNLVKILRKHNMGNIMDIVPNHMSIFENPWWADVLENGPGSQYSRFFDIDWHPIKSELREKVLLPVLDEQYGKTLEQGKIRLIFDAGAFFAITGEIKLPTDPGTYQVLLTICLANLGEAGFDAKHRDCKEIRRIIARCANLPGRNEKGSTRLKKRYLDAKSIKARLLEIYRSSAGVRKSLDDTLRMFNGRPGSASSFDGLHNFLERQAYRLSFWRVALDEINYRRFMGINDLAAVRVEDPLVFKKSHRLILQLLARGLVNGLRIDHIDGLFAPGEYLHRLQKAYFVQLCEVEMENYPEVTGEERKALSAKLAAKFEVAAGAGLDIKLCKPLFIVVEKILGEKEGLRESWPVEGTSGYDFAASLNGIYIDRRNRRSTNSVYRWFTKAEWDFDNLIYECKKSIMQTRLQAEINVLAWQLDRISESNRLYRDFTLNSLREALIEVIACFPVYRTYIDAEQGLIDEKDRAVINTAVARAKKRNPGFSFSLFDYLRDILLLKYLEDATGEGRREQKLFVMRFQQSTGPVMVKGVEDTAFYRYNPLVSLNEVGDNPSGFGNTVAGFHRENIFRQKYRRHSFLATSTHDSKRSEDVRARINVLSEIPADWKMALARWSKANKRKKKIINGEAVPDRNEEYLIYQTLLGTYPLSNTFAEMPDRGYIRRIQEYIQKAIKEAKVHTSWINQDADYEAAIVSFVSDILTPSESEAFLDDFRSFGKNIAVCGLYNSLSQTVLKIFSVGTVDLFQGNEMLNFRLVDPDNRSPVDYSLPVKLLQTMKRELSQGNGPHLTARLIENLSSGESKLFVSWKALTYKRDNPEIFNDGRYIPLKAGGSHAHSICAFVWQHKRKQLAVISPRFLWRLTKGGEMLPLGEPAWNDTTIVVPGAHTGSKYRNIFTGQYLIAEGSGEKARLPLAAVFSSFPVAALELCSGDNLL